MSISLNKPRLDNLTGDIWKSAERLRGKKFNALIESSPEVLAMQWTHRHYVKDDEYIPFGEDIEAFLKLEIAKPVIRWSDSPQLGYEILPNKYFYCYQPPTPEDELLAEFQRLEKEAQKLLEGLVR